MPHVASTAPLRVTAYEDKLLTNATLLFGDQKRGSWKYESTRPERLTDNAITLLKEILAKGTVKYLVTVGRGWCDSSLRQGAEISGRLWERHPLKERILRFSLASLELLLWWTSLCPEDVATWQPPPIDPNALTPSDEFLVWRLVDTVLYVHGSESKSFRTLCSYPLFQANPWIWLTAPHKLPPEATRLGNDLINRGITPEGGQLRGLPSFVGCCQGLRAVILEALQELLVDRLVNTIAFDIFKKNESENIHHVVRSCCAINVAYNAFLQAVADAKRPDLALFLLRAFRRLTKIDGWLEPARWWNDFGIGSLLSVRARYTARRSILALSQLTLVLGAWTSYYRKVGFYDEDYRIAQWWLKTWEAYGGDELVAKVQQWLKQADLFVGDEERVAVSLNEEIIEGRD